ncbi:MAG: hypothetical protein ACR5LD_10805 [Symbiopectobacterium sp.]
MLFNKTSRTSWPTLNACGPIAGPSPTITDDVGAQKFGQRDQSLAII